MKNLTVLKDDPRFRAFAGTDLPDAALRQEMTDEVSRMADYYTWTRRARSVNLSTRTSHLRGAAVLRRSMGCPRGTAAVRRRASTEGFDALGRARTSQRLLDEAGQLIKELPIDTNSAPRIIPGDASVSSGPTELMTRIIDSGKAEACLARQYFRFTFARWEDEKADGCTLEQLRKTTQAGKLTDVLRAVALVPQFRERRFD